MTDSEKEKMSLEFQRFCSHFYIDLHRELKERYKVRLTSLKEEPLCPGYYKESTVFVAVQQDKSQPYFLDLVLMFSMYYGKESYETFLKKVAASVNASFEFYNATLK